MRTGNVKKALRSALAANVSVFMWGQPSSAKSSITKQLAAEDGYEMIDLRLSQMDAVDLRGVPYVQDGQTFWAKPSWWPKEGVKTILFLDEMNQAAQSVQAPAYQLVLDRELGEHKLPSDTRVVAAGNRMTDGAITNKVGTALKNRFVHIEVEINNDDWLEWALTDGDMHESVISFLRFRPALLNELGQKSNTKEEQLRVANVKDNNAFATPRSWEFVNRIINVKPDKSIEQALYAGAVGEAAATEFVAFLKYYRDMPDLDALLMNPNKAPIPDNPATLYAVATGLGNRVSAGNFEAMATWWARVDKKEFEVMSVKDAVLRDPDIQRSKYVMKWMLDHKKFLA